MCLKRREVIEGDPIQAVGRWADATVEHIKAAGPRAGRTQAGGIGTVDDSVTVVVDGIAEFRRPWICGVLNVVAVGAVKEPICVGVDLAPTIVGSCREIGAAVAVVVLSIAGLSVTREVIVVAVGTIRTVQAAVRVGVGVLSTAIIDR